MKKTHVLIIASLVLLYGISNYFWLLQNKLPISYDEGIHLWTSLRFLRALVYPAHNILYELLHANTTHWPPLFYLTASLFNIVFGTSYIASVMTNMLFLLLLLISLYLIGKKLYSREVGIIAIIIVSLYPIIYGHSRLFQLDFALTALVTLGVYCLISSEGFRERNRSIIFGIAVGLGMLIKWSYVVFILPLFIYELVRNLTAIKNRESLNRASWTKNLLIAIMVGLFISSMWYLSNIDKTKFVLNKFRILVKYYLYDLSGEPYWFFLNLNSTMLSFLFFSLFIVSLVFFYIRKDLKYKSFLTVWYLGPIILLNGMVSRQPRFFMPILPCFALITAIAFSAIKKNKLKNFILAAIFGLGLIQFFDTSFNQNNIEREDWPSFIYRIYRESGEYEIPGAGPPHTEDWKHAYVANLFTSRAQRYKGYPLVVGIIYEGEKQGGGKIDLMQLFANHAMNYFLLRESLKSGIVPSYVNAPTLNKPREISEFMEEISDMLGLIYISKESAWPTLHRLKSLFTTHPLTPRMLGYDPMGDQQLIGFSDSRENFRLIERVYLPFDYYAHIYLYEIPEIKRGELSVKLFNGKIKIFYGDREITKDIAIASDIVHNKETYKYKDAIWDYDISPHQITMLSRWLSLGIAQSTLVRLDKEKTVYINVRLESQDDVTLDDWYINNVISNKYKEWVRPFSKGVFKGISMFSDPDNFELLDPGHKEINVIGVKENIDAGLPAILFRCYDTETRVYASVWNSTYLHNSRCVSVGTGGAKISRIELKAGEPREMLNLRISLVDDQALEDVVSDIEKGFSRDAE